MWGILVVLLIHMKQLLHVVVATYSADKHVMKAYYAFIVYRLYVKLVEALSALK